MNGHSETVVEQSTTEGVPTAKVVVGVDGTAANWSAVSWAVAESRRVGRPLLLVASGAGTLATGSASGDDLEAASSQRLTEDLLEGVRMRLVGQVRVVSTQVATGEPSHALLSVADTNDLLVIGKRRGNPWSTAVLGSTAVAVAARCNGLVVVVPESWAVREHRTEHIVAGINGHGDSRVVDLAFDRAHTLAVGLVVVHACSGEADVSRDEAVHRLADLLAPWKQSYPDVDVSLECHPVTPTVSLLGAATDAQLLVVGRRAAGPQQPGGLGYGSTVRKVLHHASCPVAVVPQAEGPIDESAPAES